jgi:hypothetical protein
VLSLDAPAVVIVWQWLFGAVAGVAIHGAETVVVGSSVWLAYAADRWLETWLVAPDKLVTPRHRFYARFRGVVAAVWIAVLIIDVTIAFVALTRREIAAGFIILIPVLAYVGSHQFLHRGARWRLPKELCIALLIAAGASVFVLAETADWRGLVGSVTLFALLCFTNVALIGVWEADVDRSQGQTSLAHQFAPLSSIAHLLPLALAAIAAIAGSSLVGVAPVPAHCVAASGVLLALLDRLQPRIGWRLARVLADAALLTPLLPLLRGLRS